jgi:hypothetical protein
VKIYYKDAFAALVVFNQSKPETLQKSKMWKEDIDSKVQDPDSNCPIPSMLIANKVGPRLFKTSNL